jgi:hypothetical protein
MVSLEPRTIREAVIPTCSRQARCVSARRFTIASLAKPKSSTFTCSRCRHEDVRRLDVAVDDPMRVRAIQRIGNLDGEIQREAQRQWLAAENGASTSGHSGTPLR